MDLFQENFRKTYIIPELEELMPDSTEAERLRVTQLLWGLFDFVYMKVLQEEEEEKEKLTQEEPAQLDLGL